MQLLHTMQSFLVHLITRFTSRDRWKQTSAIWPCMGLTSYKASYETTLQQEYWSQL